MNKICWTIGLLAMFSLFAGLAVATDASVELGEKLFNDPALGGSLNDKSCGSCHPGGEALDEASGQANLSEMINFCIERPLKGKKLQNDSAEMQSLLMYIKSLNK